MVYLVCVESGSNLTVLNIRLVSEKSMIAQLISKKAGKWLEYEIGESPRKETALNPKHCIDIPYHILHTMRNYLLSILKGFQPIVTLRNEPFIVGVEAEHIGINTHDIVIVRRLWFWTKKMKKSGLFSF